MTDPYRLGKNQEDVQISINTINTIYPIYPLQNNDDDVDVDNVRKVIHGDIQDGIFQGYPSN